MCQYSAKDGCASDWHLMHLGYLCASGASLVMAESTAVLPEGRITPSCLGLYSEDAARALAHLVAFCRNVGRASLGLQLGHSGRKGAIGEPWNGGSRLEASRRWKLVGASAVPFSQSHEAPREASLDDLKRLIAAYQDAARRAASIGFDFLEVHAAHGYLLHSFLSPISNRRGDAYGGPRTNRMRLPLEVFEAVRSAWPMELALGVRISGSDWVSGGADLEDAVAFARELEALGCDYVTVSSGGILPDAKISARPGYQVPMAKVVSDAVGIPVGAVGMILDPEQAEEVIRTTSIDLVFVGRGFLNDPHFLWRAAELPARGMDIPMQYLAAAPGRWPATVTPNEPTRKELR